MIKNLAGQKIAVFAFDYTTGAPKSGDAANITAYVSKDSGAVTVLGDISATEMDATNAKNWYLFDLAQAETNADILLFTGKSSTANVTIVGGGPLQTVNSTPNFTGTALSGSSNTVGLPAGTTASQCGRGTLIVSTGGATAAGSSGIVSADIVGAGGATPIATIVGTWTGANFAAGTSFVAIPLGGQIPIVVNQTLAGSVDANLQGFNGVAATGTGVPGDRIRPVGLPGDVP